MLPGREAVVPRDALGDALAAAPHLAGSWALEALRVAAAVPRLGCETDFRTIPHEVGWIGPAVHLAKGCYRGQETIARVHNLGRPPRRLALAHLDGSQETLPVHGDPVTVDGKTIGWVGSAARHFELGPIATVVLKRGVAADAPLLVGGVPAVQQVVVARVAAADGASSRLGATVQGATSAQATVTSPSRHRPGPSRIRNPSARTAATVCSQRWRADRA